ncbi:MAG TPA: hypothetical protein VGG27_16530 [Magnetospirillaceae bacterium]
MSKPSVTIIHDTAPPLSGKVTYGIEGVDDQALARAEAIIVGLQDEYLTWAEQDIQQIERRCTDMMAQPEDERAHAIRELFAVVHGMRGQGTSFGFPLITAFADSFARFVEPRTTCGAREMEIIQAHIYAIRTALADRLTEDGGVVGAALLADLKRTQEQYARG